MRGRSGPVLLPMESVEWRTPLWFFKMWDRACSFTRDLAASPTNALCPRYYTRDDSALEHDWRGARAWCNPPYDALSLRLFCQKAASTWCHTEAQAYVGYGVFLVPAKTQQVWWHAYVWDADRAQPRPGVQVWFIKGKLTYVRPGKTGQAYYPSAVVIFGHRAPSTEALYAMGVRPCNVERLAG